MRALRSLPLAALIVVAMALPASAVADECEPEATSFGLCGLELDFEAQEATGDLSTQAGSHPQTMRTTVGIETHEVEPGKIRPVEEVRDIEVTLPAGLAGDPYAVPRCSTADFLAGQSPACPAQTRVGTVHATVIDPGSEAATTYAPALYNLNPVPGQVARLGFIVDGLVPAVIDIGLTEDPPYRIVARARSISQILPVVGAETITDGVPGEKPFLTMPTRCGEPLQTEARADSWPHPGAWVQADPAVGAALTGCAKLGFSPEAFLRPTTDRAASPSGLALELDVDDPGLTSKSGKSASQIKKAVVTLPEGVTLNPSQAEGLAVCTEADLARERPGSEPGEGCPEASKVGTVQATTPLLEGRVFSGALYVAEPYRNPFDTLIALYMVVKDPGLGVIMRFPGKVEPDPASGQLITTFDDLVQFPLGHVSVRLREGARSPLITPNLCGTYTAEAAFTPWADPTKTHTESSSFQISGGPNGAPCPPGGAPPFEPGFQAGTLSANAKDYSPLYGRLTRRDGDQDMTRFSFELPPGLTGKIAGVGRCSEAEIAAARTKDGREEQADPSCPQSSLIGHVLGGAGVGSQLTYVSGSLYLAGPLGSAPLSVVAIVPAVAGPFDVGNVLTRVALKLNPITAQVEVDGANSEPLPHILAGIPLRVRDVRVNTDRPQFTLNPTGCRPKQVAGTLWGGGADPFSSADDAPITLTDPFQAVNCARLGFRPALRLYLKGGTRRGAFPALRLRYIPRAPHANLRRFALAFPRSAFIEQGHFRTICTRVQFAAGQGFGSQCPKGSIYGRVRAWTPLLDEPLTGPVFLRSSNHDLPDAVLTLHGPPSLPVHFEVATRIDSLRGRLRTIANGTPDAPISRVAVDMQGGRKGLFVNSRDLCSRPARNRARANLAAHNGRRSQFRALVRAVGCGTGHGAGRSRRADPARLESVGQPTS